MSDYTLEEVIDFINDEIEDAYTEASKKEADELARKGKRWREEYSGKSKIDEFGDKALPKGDPETVRRKDIRTASKIGNRVFQRKKEPGEYYYDHPGGNMSTYGDSPYNKKYDEIKQKEREIRDRLDKKAKDFADKEGKEYEVYYGNKDSVFAKDFIKKTRSEGKHPITYDAYSKHAYTYDKPEYKESRKREHDAFNKLSVSNRLAKKAKKGFKNKDVEAKWKKFADKYEETVYDILEAYEYDVISYEAANDYLDMLALFED